MPNDLVLKTMNRVHRLVQRASRGRMGWDAMGMPVLELTTVGRRSGQPRSVLLTSPLQVGGNLVIVASRGGDDQHPAWYLNLRDQPRVSVARAGGPPVPMNARIVTSADRAAMWAQIAEKYPLYGNYQTKTDREIPLILLEPAT